MIVPEKTIWTLDGGYPAMELYARIIENELIFHSKIKKRQLYRRKNEYNTRRFTN